jgi:cbb3-type cytochrome oxidase subunit 3
MLTKLLDMFGSALGLLAAVLFFLLLIAWLVRVLTAVF